MGVANLLGKGSNPSIKILINREIIERTPPINFVSGNDTSIPMYYVSIPFSEIGFVPRFIIVWSGSEKMISVCFIYGDTFPFSSSGTTTDKGCIFTYGYGLLSAGRTDYSSTFQLMGNAYVNQIGVQLPTSYDSSWTNYNMIAIK